MRPNPGRRDRPRRGPTGTDGEKDRWIQYGEGKPRTQLDDKNADGKPDATLHYEGDHPSRLEEDTNFDGRADRKTTYRNGAVEARIQGYVVVE